MSNDPQVDLIYAILAMDSYNRGYGSGITSLETGASVQIGGYSIVQDIEQVGWFDAGFYAIAYENAETGEIVISYRGTDFNGKLPSLTDFSVISDPNRGGSDAVYGYGLALGNTQDNTYFVSPLSLALGSVQSGLAEEFYESIIQQTDAQQAGNITLVGHSLGGGLAGYVATTTGTNAVVFDNLPYDVSGINRANELEVTAHFDSIHGYFTEGEFLQPARAGLIQGAMGGFLTGSMLDPLTGPQGIALGAETALLEASWDKTSLHSNADFLNPLSQYHSQALLTALLWNEAYGDQDWVPAAAELWGAFFDSQVADAVTGINSRTVDGIGTNSDTMKAAIAYSALPEGDDASKPFGDTGIWSMFDDAGDLGEALQGEHSSLFDDVVFYRDDGGFFSDDLKQLLADLAVQYAGALALNDLEAPFNADGTRGTISTASGSVDVTQGVLSLHNDVLSVDLSSVLWKDVFATTGGQAVDPIHADQLRNYALDNANISQVFSALGVSSADELAQRFYKATDASVIDRFDFAVREGGDTTFAIAPRSYDNTALTGANVHVDLFAGTSGADDVTGTSGNDIILGQGGSDTIDAGAGNDIVHTSGGTGATTIGGTGRDLVVNITKGGGVYGDTVSGTYEKPVYDANGLQTGTEVVAVEDNQANADLFWFAHSRVTTACNDNNAWLERTFHFDDSSTGRVAA